MTFTCRGWELLKLKSAVFFVSALISNLRSTRYKAVKMLLEFCVMYKLLSSLPWLGTYTVGSFSLPTPNSSFNKQMVWIGANLIIQACILVSLELKSIFNVVGKGSLNIGWKKKLGSLSYVPFVAVALFKSCTPLQFFPVDRNCEFPKVISRIKSLHCPLPLLAQLSSLLVLLQSVWCMTVVKVKLPRPQSLPPSCFSRAREFPNPRLALGKPVEEAESEVHSNSGG